MQRISPKVGAMHLLGRQTIQLLSHIHPINLHGYLKQLALGHLRDHAAHCYGCTAAKALGPMFPVIRAETPSWAMV